ncbi:S8 family peptidase [Chitinimonas sp.]|uniref:S8 family peptidase n=1 Tax=Chitinimonas sp. TaxID=1934313 RepID=UPI002F93AEF0
MMRLLRLAAGLCCCLLTVVWAGEPASRPPAEPPEQILVMLQLPPAHFLPDTGYSGSYGDGQGSQARWRLARQLAEAHGLTLQQGWPMSLLGVDCYLMTVPPGVQTEAVIAALSRDKRVAWAQPVHTYRTQQAEDDPLLPFQPATQRWHLAQLHAAVRQLGGHAAKVSVAVVDSGIEAQHPDLAGQVLLNENLVDDHPFRAEHHGTAVAGIIAARADNHLGIVGVAPEASLLGLRACWERTADSTICDTLSLAKALNLAIGKEAGIINLSLSGPQDRLLTRLLEVAMARGIVVIGARDPDRPDGGFPASLPGVVAVASESSAAVPANTLLAPGSDVPTSLPGGRWGLVSGSSYAAAHVSGLYALLASLGRPPEGRMLLTSGGGRVDACATLGRQLGNCVCDCSGAPPLRAAIRE